MCFISEVSWLVENFNIYSDTINVINVKLCVMVLLIEHFMFLPLSVTLTLFKGHSNVELSNQKFCSYPIKQKLCMIIK